MKINKIEFIPVSIAYTHRETSAQVDRDKGFEQLATRIVLFENAWEDFGSEAWKFKYNELLDSEPGLKAKYLEKKKKK